MKQIKYRAGYKYQLAEVYEGMIAIHPPHDIVIPFISLNKSGLLTVQAGYAWDGCSGPTWDDDTNMRAGLTHDALYQLMRGKRLDCGWRATADNELHRICREDGMGAVRAWYYRKAVRMAGEKSAEWQEEKICVAPGGTV